MPIKVLNENFMIETENTSYAFTVKNGVSVHLYYGAKISETEDLQGLISTKIRSFQPYYTYHEQGFALDNVPLEVSFFDSGDFRASAIKLRDSDGRYLSEFVFDGYEIVKNRTEIAGMPCGRGGADVETLIIKLVCGSVSVRLYYVVYPNTDVITRYTTVENTGDTPVQIEKLASGMLDLQGGEYKILTLQGRVASERERKLCSVPFGRYQVLSNKGTSSHSASPFMMLAESSANENEGGVYAMNLVYSGNFCAETELDGLNRLRACIGINEETFSHTLTAGETFCSPEVALTYSLSGYNGASIAMSDYIREYIFPERFAKACRPVVINTWEAFEFDIDEEKILAFAKIAKNADIDTLVIDDGWFSSRRSDTSGLGDWTVSPEVFPSGLESFGKKIREIGLNLGIWIEPEMVNPDSELYRKHPDWALGRCEIQSRNQLVLDMTNPAVEEYLFESLSAVLEKAQPSYVKWDMNRYLCPYLSKYTKNSAEVAHAYMLGAYRLMDRLTKRFPNILLENCSGGGGRFDAGMLYYSPQIWTSDNTCPYERAYIQAGASYAYPVSSMSCHVTATPNGGTQVLTSLDFRFGMARNGVLGYELDLFKLTDEELASIRAQIEEYRRWEDLTLNGDFYRLITPFDNSKYYAWIMVSKQKDRALLSFNTLETGCNDEDPIVKIYGLSDEKRYRIGAEVRSGKAWRLAGLKIPRAKQNGENYTVGIFEEK